MNYLQLCQRTSSEVGIAGTSPAATTSQSGNALRIVNWVSSAWLDIQRKHDDWKFMRGSFTFDTTASDGVYAYGDCTDTTTSTAISAFRAWHRDTLKIYLTSAGVAGEVQLTYIDYQSWYSVYNTGQQTDGPPRFFSIDASNRLLLAPKPDGIYTVTGEYQKSATELSGDDDTPELPSEYHEAIVYRAMMKYGRFYVAGEVYDDGKTNYRTLINEMERTQLPEFTQADPLA
jgi:hypothetical protein